MHNGAAPAPLLGALVSQLVTCSPASSKADLMLEREELILERLHGKNATRNDIAVACGVAPRTIDTSMSKLIRDGFVVAWKLTSGRTAAQWYGLTPAGIKRARGLKEMACQ